MTAEEVLRLHTEGFNRALKQQDYAGLEKIYSDTYMLVRPDGSLLNKQQVMKDLREQGLTFHSIEVIDPVVRVFGSAAILTAESRTVSPRQGKHRRRIFVSSRSMHRNPTLSGLSTFKARLFRPTADRNSRREIGQIGQPTESNKALVLEAFDTLFNKRDYAASGGFWRTTSYGVIQRSIVLRSHHLHGFGTFWETLECVIPALLPVWPRAEGSERCRLIDP